MKKNAYFFLITMLIGANSLALAMGFEESPECENITEGFQINWEKVQKLSRDIGNDGERIILSCQKKLQEVQEEKQRKSEERRREIKEQLADNNVSEERKMLLQQEINSAQQAELQHEAMGQQAINTIASVYAGAADCAFKYVNAENELRQTAVEADQRRQGYVEAAQATTEQYIAALTNQDNLKKWMLTVSGAAGLIFSSWHGTKLLASYLSYLYRNPVLAQETSVLTLKEKLMYYLQDKEPRKANVRDVIFEENLATQIDRLAASVNNTVQNNTYFRNVLFYGPPGTGKTMVSKRIARSSGLDYIYFAGSSIDQFSLEEGLQKLVELFEFAAKSSKKLVIIIDEAEVLFRNRAQELSEKSRKLLNLLLTYTGTETKDYMIIALTNRIEDIDSAFINRCDERIQIGAPGFEQRKDILKMYLQEMLVDFNAPKTIPAWKKLLGYTQQVNNLSVDTTVLSDQYLSKLAKKLDGFVGRDISKLVLSIQSAALVAADQYVTPQLIDQIVDQKITQRNIAI